MIVEIQSEAVNTQEPGRDSDGRSLVSIDKGMILRKALEQRGGLFDDVALIAALRPAQSRFQGAAVADALCSTKQNNQARVSGENICKGGVERHGASRRSNSG